MTGRRARGAQGTQRAQGALGAQQAHWAQGAQWALAAAGVAGLIAAVAARPGAAGSAIGQVWPAFVLVAGLLLIGTVADDDGLFAAAGHRLARLSRNPAMLFAGSALLIGAVTAVLNLDTSVAFLTPVLVYTARARGGGEAPLLYGSLLLANAGSLLLPGSNLTNLIVAGHLDLAGGRFLAHTWAAALAALIVTALVVAAAGRRTPRTGAVVPALPAAKPTVGIGAVAVAGAVVAVLVTANPAIPVAAIGVAAVVARALTPAGPAGTRAAHLRRAVGVLGAPVLVGLFGIAAALGTLGRIWSGPAILLSHLDSWATAALAALGSVAVNNLPAASLLAAQPPPHPYALLVGLNLGPNLFVTGSLAWFLWLRAARSAGAHPSVAAAVRIGAVAVPLSIAAALGALALTGGR